MASDGRRVDVSARRLPPARPRPARRVPAHADRVPDDGADDPRRGGGRRGRRRRSAATRCWPRSPRSLLRDNTRAAQREGAPRFAVARRRVRGRRGDGRAGLAPPAHRRARRTSRELEPVIERVIFGLLYGGRSGPTGLDEIAAGRRCACRRCPRLVAWREAKAAAPPRRFAGQTYWARPVPGFGDPAARLLVFGLAPAADGANRTGRVFTGDRSGRLPVRGAAPRRLRQPADVGRRVDDGLEATRLLGHRGGALCAARQQADAGRARHVPAVDGRRTRAAVAGPGRVVPRRVRVGFGAGVARSGGVANPRPRPRFGHGAVACAGEPLTLLGCFHPSQQNTFTGKLTEAMIDEVLTTAKALST